MSTSPPLCRKFCGCRQCSAHHILVLILMRNASPLAERAPGHLQPGAVTSAAPVKPRRRSMLREAATSDATVLQRNHIMLQEAAASAAPVKQRCHVMLREAATVDAPVMQRNRVMLQEAAASDASMSPIILQAGRR